jgi:hypothetical protein
MANQEKKPKKGQINIELDESVAEGTYSNLAIINHSVSEFVVDFVKHNAWNVPKNKVKSRIILTRRNMLSAWLKALGENVSEV